MRDKNFQHEADCVYPQTELWALCTCPLPPTPPRQPVSHDPLCPCVGPDPERHYDWWCDCEFIATVREDMLAKCITAVDEIAKTYPSDSMSSLRVLAALRALQDNP